MTDHKKDSKNDDDQSREDDLQDVSRIATAGELQDDSGAELDPMGSDQESNVTGRSKPASDGIAQRDRDERKSKQ